MITRARGFTLVELLVALAIFAVISVLTLRALSGSLEQRAHIEGEARKWRDLGRLFGMLESDLAAALGTPASPLIGRAAPGTDGIWLELARAGRDAAGETPVAPRGVVYRLHGGNVERTTSHALSAGSGGDVIGTSRFAPAVRSLALRYLSSRGDWLAEWRDATGDAPRAVELSIELQSNERVRKVMLLR